MLPYLPLGGCVEWVMLSVAHVRFRPYPEIFSGILGSLESVLPPGFFPRFVKFRQILLNPVRFVLIGQLSAVAAKTLATATSSPYNSKLLIHYIPSHLSNTSQ